MQYFCRWSLGQRSGRPGSPVVVVAEPVGCRTDTWKGPGSRPGCGQKFNTSQWKTKITHFLCTTLDTTKCLRRARQVHLVLIYRPAPAKFLFAVFHMPFSWTLYFEKWSKAKCLPLVNLQKASWTHHTFQLQPRLKARALSMAGEHPSNWATTTSLHRVIVCYTVPPLQ